MNLGLFRIRKLLKELNFFDFKSFKSVHIAGTNGKGSTVSFISSILTNSGIRTGKFISPCLIDTNDCISVNDMVYSKEKYDIIKKKVTDVNSFCEIGCTPFEILVATAFQIFNREKVDIAVIETGLGGRLDATNVLEGYNSSNGSVLVTGITIIGKDHQEFLGNTLIEIANEKLGILKKKIPCVIDDSNAQDVINLASSLCRKSSLALHKAGLDSLLFDNQSSFPERKTIIASLNSSSMNAVFQKQNLAVALKIIDCLISQFRILFNHSWPQLSSNSVSLGIRKSYIQARLQTITLKKFNLTVILDGAHNELAAIALKSDLSRYKLNISKGFIFIFAMSKSKNPLPYLSRLLNKNFDTFIPSYFSTPPEMSWVIPHDPFHLAKIANPLAKNVVILPNGNSLKNILQYLRSVNDERRIVVCGSLYLSSDLLRINTL